MKIENFIYRVIVWGGVCSSECDETVGRTVRGKSQVIVSTNDVVSVCTAVALEIDAVGAAAESSDWVELFGWWAEFLLTMNSKCTCHLTATVCVWLKKIVMLKIEDIDSPQLVLKVWVAERGIGREKLVSRVL